MTRSEAVRLVQYRLGGRFDSRTQTMIEDELRAQQNQLENRVFLPWFLFQEARFTAQVGEVVTLPDNFLREYSEDTDTPSLWFQDDLGVWKPIPREFVMDVYSLESTTGPPRAYTVMGETLQLWPPIDKAYPLRLYYFRRDQILSADIENDWLKYAPQLMWARAGEGVAVNLRDRDAVQVFAEKAAEADRELIQVHIARQDANLITDNRD